MIEINLVPDVKIELLKARRQRRMVTSGAILVAVVAGGIVVLLASYVFGVQTIARNLADSSIKSESEKLKSVSDLPKTLTIQNQLTEINTLHNDKHISSRLFDIISTIVPSGENAVAYSRISFNSEDSTIVIEGEAANGYEALEVFKKTIDQTKFTYTTDGEQRTVPLATKIYDGDRRYGEDGNGQRVLRFTLSFQYSNEIFARQSENGTIVAPTRQNATDSQVGVPESLFTSGSNE